MTRRIETMPDKRLLLVLAGSVILMLAVLVAQSFRTAWLGTGVERRSAPAHVDRFSVVGGAAASSVGNPVRERDLLRQELLADRWARFSAQSDSAAASGVDGIETGPVQTHVDSTGEVYREGAPADNPSQREQDLLRQELLADRWAQLLAQSDAAAASGADGIETGPVQTHVDSTGEVYREGAPADNPSQREQDLLRQELLADRWARFSAQSDSAAASGASGIETRPV